MMSGVFSVGVGILFAGDQQSLFTLFRVSHLTGILCKSLLKQELNCKTHALSKADEFIIKELLTKCDNVLILLVSVYSRL